MVRVAREETQQSGAVKVPRRSRNAEETATPKHRAVLQLLGVYAEQEEKHCARNRAHA